VVDAYRAGALTLNAVLSCQYSNETREPSADNRGLPAAPDY